MFCSGPYGWPYRKVTELTILHDTAGNLRQLFDSTNPLWAYRPDEELPDDVRMVRERFDATSPLSVVAGGHILEDHTDSSAELRATGLPVLVTHGEWDTAWPIPWQRDHGRGHRRRVRRHPGELARPPDREPARGPSRSSTRFLSKH